MNSRYNKILSVATLTIMGLGLAGCSTDAKQSDDPWVNANKTIAVVSELSQDEKFMDALQTFGNDGVIPAGFDEQFDKVSEIVAEDAELERTKVYAKEMFADSEAKPSEKAITLLSKVSSVMTLGGTYSLSVRDMSIQLDPTAFEEKDGVLVQTKDGGLQIVDPDKRIFDFSLVEDNIAFSGDGTKLSLKAFNDVMEKNKDSSTPLQEDIFNVADAAYSLIASGEEGDIKDMTKHEEKIVDSIKDLLITDGTFTIKGNSGEGFTVEGKSKESGETASYDIVSGTMKSNLEGKGFDPETQSKTEGTLAKNLFDEYSNSLLSTYNDKDGSFSKIPDIIEDLNTNDDLKEAKWSATEKPSSAIADIGGVKYTFGDLTEEVDEDAAPNEGSMEGQTTEDLLGIPESN